MSARNTIAAINNRCILQEDGCLTWTGSKTQSGHGHTKYHGSIWLVHRLLYETLVREIPAGIELHHTCERPDCANVTHLREVTDLEHSLLHPTTVASIHRVKMHCIRGHPLSGENLVTTDRQRACRECARQARAR